LRKGLQKGKAVRSDPHLDKGKKKWKNGKLKIGHQQELPKKRVTAAIFHLGGINGGFKNEDFSKYVKGREDQVSFGLRGQTTVQK